MSETITVSVRMPAELHGMLKILAGAEGRSLSKEIIQIILDWVTMMKDLEEDSPQAAARVDIPFEDNATYVYTGAPLSEKDFFEARQKWQMWRPSTAIAKWATQQSSTAFTGTVVEFTPSPSVSGITGVQCQLSINIDDSYDPNSVKALVESNRVSIQPLEDKK